MDPTLKPQKILILKEEKYMLEVLKDISCYKCLVGIIFLYLVVFIKQLLVALVGSGRNCGFVLAPLDDCDFTVRAWQVCSLLSPGFWAKKEQDNLFRFPALCRY